MELRTLRAFAEVVKQGSFSGAAAAVFTTQSTVSKAVKQLEDELGVPLLQRNGRQSKPTAEGEIVYARALSMLAERRHLEAELEELKGLSRGTLRLGFLRVGTSSFYSRLIAEFRRRYPRVQLTTVADADDRLEEMLLRGDIDLMATVHPMSPTLDSQHVHTEGLVALVPGQGNQMQVRSTDLASLVRWPFILFEEGSVLNRLLLQACARQNVEPRIAFYTGQVDLICELAAEGVGVGFLPRFLTRRRFYPGVDQVEIAGLEAAWAYHLAWRRGAYLSRAARAWLDLSKVIYQDGGTAGETNYLDRPPLDLKG